MLNKDDVLPLSKPFTGISGKVYKEFSVPAGTVVLISPIGYNLCVRLVINISARVTGFETGSVSYRDEDLFGKDAHIFNPNRWLEGGEESNPSSWPYSGLCVK